MGIFSFKSGATSVAVATAVGALLAATTSSAQAGEDTMGENDAHSTAMRLVRIEQGSFIMGQADGDWDEQPVHKVTISQPFLMAATEVTNAQYEQFDPDHRKYRGIHGFSKGDDEPAVFVSWHDAVRFCQWLTEKEGKPFRLPTEAEWEYACRAGTGTAYNTGDALPEEYCKNQREMREEFDPVDLRVARTPPNAWGMNDVHGNVEEWCLDWYGPYEAAEQADPVGRADGDFKVARGGSHSTEVQFLRSANRMGTLPNDRHWLLGFRVVQAEAPKTAPLTLPGEKPLWARGVSQKRHDWSDGPDMSKPHFLGPRKYVKIPPGSNGPMFSKHNHQPAITACPNGDLLAIWYSCNREPGRELAVVAARLRHGSQDWEPAAPFWDAPDRNDHGSAIWWDGKDTLYHLNGLSTDVYWAKLALILRTSTDNGATWSKARLINPNHQRRNQVIAGTFSTREGFIIQPCDAGPGGNNGGTAIHVSRDQGNTWLDPGAGRPDPVFAEGRPGAWIAGIHGGVAQRNDGALLAFGRGGDINDRMPMSLSTDMGQTWMYHASPFPPIGGGQRLVLGRLQEGPLLLVSFTNPKSKPDDAEGLLIPDAAGKDRRVYGMFAALSFDEAATWPLKKLVTAGGPPRQMDGGGNTHEFTMDDTHAEPAGYLAATQTPDGVIHLISSALHYRFNLAWLKTPMPAQAAGQTGPAAMTREQIIEQTMKPYTGPSAPGVDTKTLTGKVMCGYQGWFNAEGDGAGRGWNHWGARGVFKPGACKIDLWPDLSDLDPDERYATPFRLADGRPAEVFSSFNANTGLRHFQWMRDYAIDGAFVQRFGTTVFGNLGLRHNNTVLDHCREGANRYGRAYAVMYDLSGMEPGQIPRLIEDWKLLVDRMQITRDKAYLHHNGKPVVSLWGFGFKDRKCTPKDGLELVRFFKDDPRYGNCTVMLGVPTGWRTLDRDCLKDPAMPGLLLLADIISPWTVGRYRTPEQAADHAEKHWAPDVAWCKEHGKDYLPVVFPGFSWHNMKPEDPFDAIPRLKGQFLWTQYVQAKKAGAAMIYQAMFDEVDEGTAIFKCTNNPPVGPSRFVTYEGLPSDHYLWLAGMGARLLRGEIPITGEMPKKTRE